MKHEDSLHYKAVFAGSSYW